MKLRQTISRYLVIILVLTCSLATHHVRGQEHDTDGAQAKVEKKINSIADEQLAEDAADTNAVDARSNETPTREGVNRNALVVRGRDAVLKKGETAEAIVVIGGSAKVYGKVRGAAVVIGGDLDIEGEVGEAAVAVMGKVRAGEGARIKGEVVSVGGKVDVADGARISGEVVSVGGKVDVAEGGKVEGQVQEIDPWGNFPHADSLREWFSRGFLQLRPLAPGVGWVWILWLALLLLYLLIATAFPKMVKACVDELERRPATAFLMGLLTEFLVPLILLILVVIVVGVVVVPFVIAALVLGFIVGKVAILEWLGFKIGRRWQGEAFKPVMALLLGAVVLTVLYLLPMIGMLTLLVTSVWGLGSVVMAAFGGLRGELPEKTPPPIPTPAANPAVSPTPAGSGIGLSSAPAPTAAFEPIPSENVVPPVSGFPSSTEVPPTIGPQTVAPQAGAVASLPDAWAFPKANYWERMAAAFLDIVLIGILGRILAIVLGNLMSGPTQGFLVVIFYFAGMWAWKSTTIGGIVIGLKVARLDGQAMTFPVALVRALAAAFSAAVFFLGFLWIIWDKERQGWHDRIAGTVVVKLPKGTPLVVM
jgi:uncharacterized RDD family membrane protein YckC